MTSKPAQMRSPSATVGAELPAPLAAQGAGWVVEARRTLHAYTTLAKPGIVWLLLVTTVPAMVLAAEGWPDTGLVLLTLVGGMLTAGGANAMNQWFDRDIDAVMARTRRRPLPQGRITPRRALLFGLALAALGGVELGLAVNALSAALALAAVAFYVLVYTVWLKRRTPQNIVIGGAAGAVPPLVGWAAVRGDIEVAPLLLFLIVFLWTPPHFWALALRYKDEYARAGIPMLPVAVGEAATKRQMLWYSVALMVASVLLVAVGAAGWLYLGVAIALGLLFIALAGRLWRGRIAPMTLFWYSIIYLPLLFIAAAVDEVVL